MPPLEIPKPTFDQELKKDIETAKQILTNRLWSNVFSDLWLNPNAVAQVKLNSLKPNTSAVYLIARTPGGLRLMALNETNTNGGTVYTDPSKPNKTWRSIEKYLREQYPSFIGLATYRVHLNRGGLRRLAESITPGETLTILYPHIAVKKLEHYFNLAVSLLLSNKEFIGKNPTFRKFLAVISANNITPQILAEHSGDERDMPQLYNWLVDNITHFTKAKSERDARGLVQLTQSAYKDLQRDFPSIFKSLTYEKVAADPDLSMVAMILTMYSEYKLLSSRSSNFSILRTDGEIREFLYASYNRGIFAFGSTNSLGIYTLEKGWRSHFNKRTDQTFRYLDKIRRFSTLLSLNP